MRNSSSTNSHNDNYPNRSFFTWIKSNTALYIAQIIAIISILYTIIATIYYLGNNKVLFSINAVDIQGFINYAHLFFVLIVVLILLRVFQDSEHGIRRVNLAHEVMFKRLLDPKILENAENQVKNFKLYFILFWVSIGLLYVGFLVDKNLTYKHKIINLKHTVDYEYNGRETIVALPFHKEIPEDTQYIEGFKIDFSVRNQPLEKSLFFTTAKEKAVGYIIGEWVPFIFNVISTMFIFWCYSVLYSPKHKNAKRKRAILRLYSLLFSALLIFAYPLLILMGAIGPANGEFNYSYLIGYMTVFNGVSGILNAVVLSLLIGRLDSKLIGLSVGLISILYVYAAVQPLFVVFVSPVQINENIKTFVLLTVFSFKIYFFLIIVYILQSGRLLNYLCCFPTLHTFIDSIWGNRFEIIILEMSSNQYKYIIRKNDHIVFKTDLIYESRDIAHEFINQLRKIMADKNSYIKFDKTASPHIEIKDSNKKSICFSEGINAKNFNSFIDECVDKIPYCKIRYS
jgi:hypothetical protein